MPKPRINVHLSKEVDALLKKAVANGAASKTSVVDAAIKEFLDKKIDERQLTLLNKRLDRMAHAMDRLSHDAAAQSETLALFVLYYLCMTPPLPDERRAGAEAVGRKRFEHFMAQVGDRLAGEEHYAQALLQHMGLEADKPQRKLEAAA